MGPSAPHIPGLMPRLAVWLGAARWHNGVLGLAFVLQACASITHPPLTMPMADGRDQPVQVSGSNYVVNRRERGANRPGIDLRVTRVNGGDLDYSDGLRTKKAVEAYCATFNRPLDPRAFGRFSTPNAWVFEGDCL